MDTSGFITKIRELIINNTSIRRVYSPQAPVDKTEVASITYLGGIPLDNLNGLENIQCSFRVLYIGNTNDKETRGHADEIFNLLHNNDGNTYSVGNKNYKIITIRAITTPVYAGRDEELNISYNITFNSIIKEVR